MLCDGVLLLLAYDFVCSELSKIAHTEPIADMGWSPEQSFLQLVFARFFVV
jgi:hypothetical protein